MTLNNRRRALMMHIQGGGRLPSEYQEVQFIESHGREWIVPGITANRSTKINIDYAYVDSTVQYAGLFGCGYADNDRAFFMLVTGAKTRMYANFGNIARTSIKQFELDNLRHQVQLSQDGWYVDGELHCTWAPQADFIAYGEFRIFGAHFGGQAKNIYAKVYSCQLYESDSKIRDFVPCYRKADGAVGMYDLCETICPLTGTPFYVNDSGSGAFTKGANV